MAVAPSVAGRGVFVAALALYLATAGGSLATTDAVVTFDLTRNLVEHRSIALSGNLLGLESMRGADGRYYSPFGLAQSVWNVPFYLAGRAAATWGGVRIGSPDTLPKAAVALGVAVAAALAVWATFLLGARMLRSARAGALAAFVLGACTLHWPYSKFGFNQPLASLFLVGALHGVWRGARDEEPSGFVWAGIWLGAALLTRHEMALLVLPMGVFLAVELGANARRWRDAVVRLAPGAAGAFAFWLAYNFVRFHHPFDTGLLRDSTPAFGGSLADGLRGLLVAPEASLFVYSPPAIVGVAALAGWWKRDRAAAWLLGGTTLVFVLFYAQLGNWIGGRSYGSRYLVPLLPLLSIAAVPLLGPPTRRAVRVVAIALCALGAAAQAPGVLVDFAKVRLATVPADVPPDDARRRAPISLVLNTQAAVWAVPRNVRYLVGADAPPSVSTEKDEGDRTFSQRFGFSLDLWWLYLFYMGAIPAGLAVLTGSGLAVVSIAAAAWVRRRTGEGA